MMMHTFHENRNYRRNSFRRIDDRKNEESQRSNFLLSPSYLSYRRVPSRISKDVSRFFIERVLRASRSKRVTTLQLRCISGF